MSPASQNTQPKNGQQTCSPCHILLEGYFPYLFTINNPTIAKLNTNLQHLTNGRQQKMTDKNALSPYMDEMVISALRMRKCCEVALPKPVCQVKDVKGP